MVVPNSSCITRTLTTKRGGGGYREYGQCLLYAKSKVARYFHRVSPCNGKAVSKYRTAPEKRLIGLSECQTLLILLVFSNPGTGASGILGFLRRVSDSTVVLSPSLLVDELLRCSDISELVTEQCLGKVSYLRPKTLLHFSGFTDHCVDTLRASRQCQLADR